LDFLDLEPEAFFAVLRADFFLLEARAAMRILPLFSCCSLWFALMCSGVFWCVLVCARRWAAPA
jgi:hypothetical protein